MHHLIKFWDGTESSIIKGKVTLPEDGSETYLREGRVQLGDGSETRIILYTDEYKLSDLSGFSYDSTEDDANIILVKEKNNYAPYYLVKHGYPYSNDPYTLLVRKHPLPEQITWIDPGVSNDSRTYISSNLHECMNDYYENTLSERVKDKIQEISIKYDTYKLTNSLGGATYSQGTVNSLVFALEEDDYPTTLKIAYLEGLDEAVNQWTRSLQKKTTIPTNARAINTLGSAVNLDIEEGYAYPRPAFVLPSTTIVFKNSRDEYVII